MTGLDTPRTPPQIKTSIIIAKTKAKSKIPESLTHLRWGELWHWMSERYWSI